MDQNLSLSDEYPAVVLYSDTGLVQSSFPQVACHEGILSQHIGQVLA